MVNPVNNSAQQAYLNAFQKDGAQVQNRKDKEEEQNRATGASLAAASPSGEKAKNAAVTPAASGRESRNDQDSSRAQRGRLVDVTV